MSVLNPEGTPTQDQKKEDHLSRKRTKEDFFSNYLFSRHYKGKVDVSSSSETLSSVLERYAFLSYEAMYEAYLEESIHDDFLRILGLFPHDYNFLKDDIIQLWLAVEKVVERILNTRVKEDVKNNTLRAKEDVTHWYFQRYEEMQILLVVGVDKMTHLPTYRVSLPSKYEIKPSDQTSAGVGAGTFKSFSEQQERKSDLHTLVIYPEPGFQLDEVPRTLFLISPQLRLLDLSRTNITDLPSSIENCRHLRYLNLSNTPITTLPDSVTSLEKMQTLKLRHCSKLFGLPSDVRKLINLLHLEVDPGFLMVSMPQGVGDLILLRTLSVFIVGKQDGYRLTELTNMNNICGPLSIWRLENVSSEEAKGASLDKKIYLKRLELQWSEKSEGGFEILENLQPHDKIEELQILGYGGAKFSSWIGDPSFSLLTTITIHDCINCKILPPLGKLPCLKSLCLSDMNAIEEIDHQFCGRKMGVESHQRGFEVGTSTEDLIDANRLRAFQSLENFTLNGMPKLEKWSAMEECDFPCLRKLKISDCPALNTIPELSVLKSLQQIEISFCPLIEYLPNKRLPTSLQSLIIIDCPLLKAEENRNQGDLAHIPNLWVDFQQFSQYRESSVVQFEAAEMEHSDGAEADRYLPAKDGTESSSETTLASVETDEYLRVMIEIERRMETSLFPSNKGNAGGTVQIALTGLEDEFRNMLIIYMDLLDTKPVHPSSSSPWPEAIHNLSGIAERMISGGYLHKCLQVYASVRKPFIDAYFQRNGIKKLPEVGVKQPDMEEQISRWIGAAKGCVSTSFANENVLCERIFEDLWFSAACFAETVRMAAIQLFTFPEYITVTTLPHTTLPKILDLFDALLDLLPDVNMVFRFSSMECIQIQVSETLPRLSEVARRMLSEYASIVQCDSSHRQTLLDGGKIHHLTLEVISYIKALIPKYKQTLVNMIKSKPWHSEDEPRVTEIDSSPGEEQSPIAYSLIRIMMNLQLNLKEKSKNYNDAATSQFFLANNIYHIFQMTMQTEELQELIGNTYLRKLSSEFSKAAQTCETSTWMKMFDCVCEEGLLLSRSFSSEPSESSIKERYTAFNLMLAETRRTRAVECIRDPQLRKELWTFLSEKLILAYDAFLSRYRGHPDIQYWVRVRDLQEDLFDFFQGVSLV